MAKQLKTFAFLPLMAALAFLAGCGGAESQPKKIQPGDANRVQEAIQADVVEVRRGDVSRPLVVTGTVLPSLEANVGSKIAGRIEKIAVEEGGEVRQGDLLFRMERSDLLLAEKAAPATLAMAEASLREASLAQEKTGRDRERYAALRERKVISQQQLDDSETAHALAASRLDLAKGRLAEAEAGLALSRQRLEDSVVFAPFSGVVVKKTVNEAEIVSPGVPVIALMAIDRVKAEVEIPETSLTAVKRGTPVRVLLDALPGETFRGAVSRLNARVSPLSRSFKAEIDIPNPARRIQPGMFARITVATDLIRNAIVIPQRAMVTDGRGNPAVFAVREERAVSLGIRTGLIGGGLVEVREGLSAGERVVVGGNYGMEENVRIRARIVPY